MSENKIALITGASTGIGKAFSHVFAREGYDVVLVARSENKLLDLKNILEEKYKIVASVVVQDLTETNASQNIFDQFSKIDVLINNAGFGEFGSFVKTSWDKESKMIDLNVKALTYLSDLYVRKMVEAGSGKVLNVASTAAFMPGPGMAVYFATKAYVLSFSEALSEELRGTGVEVMTLCPGATRSDFQKNASLEGAGFVQGDIPSSREVAEYGYKALMKNKIVAVHGFRNWFMTQLPRVFPRRLIRAAVRKIMS